MTLEEKYQILLKSVKACRERATPFWRWGASLKLTTAKGACSWIAEELTGVLAIIGEDDFFEARKEKRDIRTVAGAWKGYEHLKAELEEENE